jgi:hypothetical protein
MEDELRAAAQAVIDAANEEARAYVSEHPKFRNAIVPYDVLYRLADALGTRRPARWRGELPDEKE